MRKTEKALWLAIPLALFAILQGCGQPDSSAPPPSSSSQAGFSSQQPAVEEEAEAGASQTFYPADQYGWDDDGTLFIREGNTLSWIGLDNRPVRSIELALPEGFSSQELSVGERYIFAAYCRPQQEEAYREAAARVLKRDGAYTLVNCALYDKEGMLYRAFPTVSQQELAQSYFSFENSSSCNFFEVHWLDESHFVIDDSARIFVYDLQQDALTLAADYTEDKELGYTVGLSGSYGIVEYSYTDGGLYYFTGADFDRETVGQTPVRHFYTVDRQGSVSELALEPGVTMIQAENGIVSSYAGWDGNGVGGLEGWYQLAGEDTLHAVGRYSQGYFNELLHGNGRISYMETHVEVAPDGIQASLSQVLYRTLDLKTGAESVFDPLAYDYGDLPEPTENGYFHNLLGAGGDGPQFLYMLGWEEPVGPDSIVWHYRLYLYDCKSGQAHLLGERDSGGLWVITPHPSWGAAIEQWEEGVRVLALEAPQG